MSLLISCPENMPDVGNPGLLTNGDDVCHPWDRRLRNVPIRFALIVWGVEAMRCGESHGGRGCVFS